jgi:hypothetical protein
VNWQPIETAPRDQFVLVYARRPSRHHVCWDVAQCESPHGTWRDQSSHEIELYDWRVTHWMPLPDPPSQERT